MELKLIVLAGAKQGTEIPLKKDKFVIGRAKECSLRAGSEAISRRHCAIVRNKDAWTVRDLGSRNGTHVNEQKIEQEVPLKAGDELRVGPLKFRVAAISAATIPALPIPHPPGPVKVQDIKRGKQPPVKDVADVAERIIGKSGSEDLAEDDISRWLLGVKDGSSDAKETLTLRLEETKSLSRKPVEDGAADEVSETEETKPVDSASEAATEKSGWNWFKRGKAAPPKKKPGKLPPRPNDGPVKSSGDAAADVLREMTRRR